MGCRDWIAKVIKVPAEDRIPNRDGVMTSAQRGYVYRLFAHFGGTLVLDAVIACLSPHGKPQQVEDAPAWFDDATADIVRSRAAMAAFILTTDCDNVMRLLKLAPHTIPAGSEVNTPDQMRATDYEMTLRELQRLLGPVAAETASS
jgi:hypothetical protein